MSRIVFWIILIIVVGFAVRAKLRAAMRRAETHVPPPRPSAQSSAVIENMTSCAHCGLHFPASEAVRVAGHDYCSPAHAAKIGN
ncbi:MAG: uncharacterized protein V7631_118 [Massilia sp.]|jgi:uncharacterized protein